MVGVAAGMATCALGMLIGQVMVSVAMWVRGRRGGYARVEMDAEDAPAYLEKEPLVTEEGLPKYEAVENALVVEDEKK